MVVRCNGKEVTGSQFSHDPKGRSGTVTLAKGNTFEWSPFDRIDLEIRDRDRPNGTLLSLQFRGYQAASGLLDEHPLDGLAGADPEVRP